MLLNISNDSGKGFVVGFHYRFFFCPSLLLKCELPDLGRGKTRRTLLLGEVSKIRMTKNNRRHSRER